MKGEEPAVNELTDRVEICLDRQVRPFLRLHGGDCELISITDGVARIRFLMACTACPLRPLTLLAGVRPRLVAIDGIDDVEAIGVGISEVAKERIETVMSQPTVVSVATRRALQSGTKAEMHAQLIGSPPAHSSHLCARYHDADTIIAVGKARP